jgi:hypothetical protein
MRWRLGWLMVALALAALVAPGLAQAHGPSFSPPIAEAPALVDAQPIEALATGVASPAPAQPSGLWPGWYAVAAALAGAMLLRRAPRRTVALALVLLLAVFAYENGLHSVHHGADRQHMASCALSAASNHLSATVVDQPICAEATLYTLGSAPVLAETAPIALSPGVHQGRAPPAPSL